MTRILSVDPGENTGVALGFYDAFTPFQLLARWQVHGGVDGFMDWMHSKDAPYDNTVSEAVVERFVPVANDFAPDLSGVPIEGVIALWGRQENFPIHWQTRTDKASLVRPPASATTKAQRQRYRFDFLERHGLFAAGTENDDSNDAITHALVNLRRRKHVPTITRYWGGPR